MKKLFISWLVIIFSVAAYPAAAQVKNDFSDWNVPPPVPPSTLPKQPNKNNAIVLPQADVPIPAQPVTGPVILAGTGTIITSFLIVQAPSQPEFEGQVQQGNGLPQPPVPDAIDPPKPAPKDRVNDGPTAMPVVAAPDMPSMPQFPDASAGNSSEKMPKLPILPVVVRPATGAPWAGTLFPFTLWAVPAIPNNVSLQKPALSPGTTGSKRNKPATPMKNKNHSQ